MWGAVARGIGGALVGEVAVGLALNTTGFDKGVSENVKKTEKAYNNAFNGIGNAGSAMFSKLGKLAAAFGGVAAIVKFSKTALQLGSDLQEVQNVVDVTFGSMSEAVNEYAQSAITTAGLSETVAKKYMGTFGAMNNQFGFTTKESYEMSKAITQLTGDVASFYNLSSDEAYTKLKSIWTGETETLKEIGVVMTQNALDQYALANGYGKTTAKMTEQEKVALRYAFVQDKLRLASGDFVRTQDSWANSTRVLTLRWQQFMATVGQGLINVLTPLVKMLNVLMGKLQSFANAFRNFTASLFGDANSGSGGIASTATNISDGLSGIGTSASDSAKQVSDASKEMKKSLAGVDELNVINNTKDTGTSTDGISGIGSAGITDIGSFDVSSDVNSSGGAISKLADKIKELIKPLQEIDFTNLKNGLDKVKTALEPITKKLGEGLEWIWYNILVPVATWTIEDAVPAFFKAIAGALDVLNGMIDMAKPYLQWLWEDLLLPLGAWTGGKIVEYLTYMGDKLSIIGKWLSDNAPTVEEFREEVEPLTHAFKEIGKFLGKIIELEWAKWQITIEGLWNYALKPIWEYLLKPLLTQFWAQIKGLASIIGGIFEAFNKLMEGDWKGAGQSIVDGLTEGIMTIWDGSFVKKYLYEPIVGGFKQLFGINSPSTVFKELGGFLLAGLEQGLGSLKTWAINKFNDIKTGFSNAATALVNTGQNLKNGLTTGIGNLKTWASGKLTDIKNGFADAWTKGKEIGGNIWSGLKNAFSSKKLGLSVSYDTNVGTVKTAVYKALGLSGWPKLSFLAQGGWVAANNPQLAVIGDNKREGEIVAPESKIREQVKQAISEMGGAGKQELSLTLYVKYEDGKTIIKKVNQAQIDAGEVLLIT